MTTAFSLSAVPPIAGGPGTLATIGDLAAALGGKGSTVLLAADPGLGPSGAIDAAAASLRRAGLGVALFDRIKSDPTMAQTDEAAELARREKAATVVALGGGSAMDLGKAVAAVAAGSAPAVHYGLCANPMPAQPLRKICVPTTSGTGSETTRTSVLTDAAGAKVWLWGDELRADAVVLDPELVTGLPAALTAATGIDALVHATEAATNANATAANDVYCHAAIRLVVAHLLKAVEKPRDLAARGAMQHAAALAGIGIDNAGTAVAHNIGHALASLRPVHHGRIVGLAMLATLPWNIADDDGRFAAVAEAMGAPRDATALPAAFERLLRESGVKVSLTGEGHDDVTPERLAAQMVRPENASMRKSNRRPISDDDLLVFARAVLSQT
jgi:alcohol dehydrogenase class IV